QWPRPQIPP
uniref:Bradykinin-potentiating peptide 9a n=1 Tax=Bothrops neuwiedi TaxID=95648 RepID=BPP9A_BOTNU|nr:RecName: Full=Bradykinin-potentiating peptide 9a; Short=BPP-9; Short=BPP-9a; Short=BPP-a [Bothrops neuwiedi]